MPVRSVSLGIFKEEFEIGMGWWRNVLEDQNHLTSFPLW